MIQLVWLTIGFQIFIAFTLSYKLFIPSLKKMFLPRILESLAKLSNILVLTEYSAFKSSSKMIQEQGAAAVIIVLISEKNMSREKGGKKKNLFETLA